LTYTRLFRYLFFIINKKYLINYSEVVRISFCVESCKPMWKRTIIYLVSPWLRGGVGWISLYVESCKSMNCTVGTYYCMISHRFATFHVKWGPPPSQCEARPIIVRFHIGLQLSTWIWVKSEFCFILGSTCVDTVYSAPLRGAQLSKDIT